MGDTEKMQLVACTQTGLCLIDKDKDTLEGFPRNDLGFRETLDLQQLSLHMLGT